MMRLHKKVTFVFVVSALLLPVLFVQCGPKGPDARDVLIEKIKKTIQSDDGTIGLAVKNLNTGDTLFLKGSEHMVMQSVMKFPIALAVLHEIDLGHFALDSRIHVLKDNLPKRYLSTQKGTSTDQGLDIRVDTLLREMVSESDNEACDVLIAKLGSMALIEEYIHSLDIKNISLKATERQMAAKWEVQYTNWAEPRAMTGLLEKFYKTDLLKSETKKYLLNCMVETSTGANRIKGYLPAHTWVAHKTGSSSTNSDFLSPATNDVGLIRLPDGEILAIAIFVMNSHRDIDEREGLIAALSKEIFDYYSAKDKP